MTRAGALSPCVRHIAAGEHAIGSRADEAIATTLGSCVAACLWDPAAGIGGMNHILLPDREGSAQRVTGVGAAAMEQLVNALLKAGGERGRLRAKAFGGANMIRGLRDIGALNTAFLLDYLRREGIPCDGQSLGGTRARQVRFWPHGGAAQQRFLSKIELPPVQPPRAVANDVELF